MPSHGWIPVTVPGAPSAWAELSKKFGRLPLTEVLQPAIDYALNGYPLTPVLEKYWQSRAKVYKKSFEGEEYPEWLSVFTLDGRAPEAEEMWKSEDHANTLQGIAETNGESLYRGALADKIVEASEKAGGFLRKSDLENHHPEWVETIPVSYHGHKVCGFPQNGQVIVRNPET